MTFKPGERVQWEHVSDISTGTVSMNECPLSGVRNCTLVVQDGEGVERHFLTAALSKIDDEQGAPEVSPRAAILREAESLITGDRNSQYGPPTQDFTRTAAFWTTYLGDKLKDGEKVQAHDIAAMMALLKLSRITWSPEKQDSWADAAGYIGCGWECVVEEQSQ